MRENAVEELSEKEISNLIEFRKHIHSNPELSGMEQETAKSVIEYLNNLGCFKVISGIGGNGILAFFDSGKEGPSVMFRAELDALPIQEENSFEHRSTSMGVAHVCGHDGHLTILLALASLIKKNRPQTGKVSLLFQPEEETGRGAEAMLRNPVLRDFSPDLVYALHNLPGYPLGTVVLKKGPFTASVISVIFRLRGKTAHAAEPEHGINPAMAMAEIIKESHFLNLNEPKRSDFSLVVPIHARLGEKAYGTSPSEAEIHFTIRCWTEKQMLMLKDELADIGKKTADKYKLNLTVASTDHFRANENSDEALVYLENATDKLKIHAMQREYPFKWGEDFGLFTQKFKGAMFGLGSGEEHPALHNPDYDFPDELIITGSRLFFEMINQIQNT